MRNAQREAYKPKPDARKCKKYGEADLERALQAIDEGASYRNAEMKSTV